MHIQFKKPVTAACTLVDFIAQASGLSKTETKKALAFGGGWVRQANQKKPKRVRRATAALTPGDEVAFYYKADLLHTPLEAPVPIIQTAHWGVWHKPVNVPSQGTPYGDKGCMEQQVQVLAAKPVHLVHRLDREASGVMLLAYSKKAASAFGQIWPTTKVTKIYWAKVTGAIEGTEGTITLALDGKAAASSYQIQTRHPTTTEVLVTITTGRFHQIRRHLDMIGHPILGDPKYGTGNKHADGLHLVAQRLLFQCPLTHKNYCITVPSTCNPFIKTPPQDKCGAASIQGG